MLDHCVNVHTASISGHYTGVDAAISHCCVLLLWQLLGMVSDGIALGWEGSEGRAYSSK